MKGEVKRGISRMKALGVTSAAALVPFAAMAQDSVDVTAIESKITMYATAAVGLIIAFAVARWGKRAARLVG